MSSDSTVVQPPDPRAIWRLGDYPKIATETIGKLGVDLVAAAGISLEQRVLDVAAGAGNAAIPAAHTGAAVVAVDITPELLAAGERRAIDEGLDIEWVEGDAQDLPFEDAEFDVVMSSIGAMFAFDHVRTASELLRVCKPGGTIAMANWSPGGTVEGFFKSLSRFAPEPPPGAAPPISWGDEDYLRRLFGDGIDSLSVKPEKVRLDHFDSYEHALDYYRTNFGPAIAAFAAIADDPAKVRQLEQDYLEFTRGADLSGGEGRPILELEYNLFVAKRSA